MSTQTAASGSSASRASSTASTRSPPPRDVTMSNHASQTSIAPVAAASGTIQREPRNAAQVVAAKAAARPMSNPTHAMS